MAVRWIWLKEVAGRLQMQETGRMLAVGGEQAGTVSSMRSTRTARKRVTARCLGTGTGGSAEVTRAGREGRTR